MVLVRVGNGLIWIHLKLGYTPDITPQQMAIDRDPNPLHIKIYYYMCIYLYEPWSILTIWLMVIPIHNKDPKNNGYYKSH